MVADNEGESGSLIQFTLRSVNGFDREIDSIRKTKVIYERNHVTCEIESTENK